MSKHQKMQQKIKDKFNQSLLYGLQTLKPV